MNEKKNLRLLLASMHEVWTCDELWKDVSLKDLLEDEKLVSVFIIKNNFIFNFLFRNITEKPCWLYIQIKIPKKQIK